MIFDRFRIFNKLLISDKELVKIPLKSSILLVVLILLLAPAIAQSTYINNPEPSDVIDREGDWDLVWYTDPEAEEKTVDFSEVELDDGQQTLSEEIERDSQLWTEDEDGDNNYFTDTYTRTYDYISLNSLETGEWTVTVEDHFEDGTTTSDSVTFDTELDGSTDLTINNIETGFSYGEDFKVDWTSTNNYDIDQTIEQTNLTLEDSQGNEETVNLVREFEVDANDDQSFDYTFDQGDYQDLEEGPWTLTVEDDWQHDTAQDSDSFSVDLADIDIDFVDPSSGEAVEVEEGVFDLDVEFNVDVENADDYTVDYYVTDTGGESVGDTEFLNLDENDEEIVEDTLNVGDLDLENSLDLEVDVSSTESGETQEIIAFDVNVVEGSEDGDEADLSTTIDSVGYDDEGNDLVVERTSTNDGDLEIDLQSTEFELFDTSRIFTDDLTVNNGGDLSGGDSETSTYTLNVELDPSTDYNLEVTDSWSNGEETSDSKDFTTEGEDTNGEEETNGDDGDDEDNGDTDGDDTEDTDTTDEETNGETNGEDDPEDEPNIEEGGETSEDDDLQETDDDETTESEETETDDECPEGFEYDEENDVCIESDDESEGSVGALDTVTSPEVAGIPVWLITVLAAFAGLQAYWW